MNARSLSVEQFQRAKRRPVSNMAAVNMARNVHVQNEISNRNGIVVTLGIYHRENLASIAGADRAQRSCNFVSFRKNRRFVGRGKVLKEVDSATRRRKCL